MTSNIAFVCDFFVSMHFFRLFLVKLYSAPIFCLNALFSTTLKQTRVQFKSTTLSINIPIDRVPLQTRDVQNWNSGLFFQAYDVQAKNENKLRFL